MSLSKLLFHASASLKFTLLLPNYSPITLLLPNYSYCSIINLTIYFLVLFIITLYTTTKCILSTSVSCRHPAAIILLATLPEVAKLRRHRSRDRARDDARLRRQGTAVRQARQPQAVVEQ